jgi:putative SOS response-associated peptidase YedK
MCGRYTLANPNPRRLRLRFGITEEAEIEEEPRFNIAPTDPVLAVRERSDEREIGTLRWGLVPGKWATEKKGRPLINARAESIQTQPAFAESFRERRCLVPADGFYEWRREGRAKQPFLIHTPNDRPLAFAGLWAPWRDPSTGEWLISAAVVTTAANETVGRLHNRMPAILGDDEWRLWIDPELRDEALLRDLLQPADDNLLELRAVSKLVNNANNEGAALLLPPEADSTQSAPLTLFG